MLFFKRIYSNRYEIVNYGKWYNDETGEWMTDIPKVHNGLSSHQIFKNRRKAFSMFEQLTEIGDDCVLLEIKYRFGKRIYDKEYYSNDQDFFGEKKND